MPKGYTFDSNHGPGVGMSSSGSSSSGSGGSSSSGGSWSNVQSSINSLVRSVSNAASTNASKLGASIRETLSNPSTSARQAMAYDSYLDDYGLGFDMDDYLSQLTAIADKNNEWSAAQADKMMNFQRRSDADAMAWSAAEAAKSRAWTENLSNTAHQREVKDLLAAGLNPILAANQGAWSGSGATGQGFSSSGAMGETDTGATGAFANAVSGMMTSARDLAITKLQTDAQRYSSDRAFASSKLATEASIYNNQNSVSAQKAISALNRDADIRKASISADATKAAAGANAGAIMSAAATNAAAARYTADQHLEGQKYNAEQQLEGSKYNSDQHLTGVKYTADNLLPNSPYALGWKLGKYANEVAGAMSNFDNTYSPDFTDYNLLGTE